MVLAAGPFRWLKTRWRGLMYVWLAAIGALLIFLPLPDPDFGPFKGTEEAEQFLRTLWQVEAAALALSLTIIVFAIQAYRSSTQERYGGTLRRFIRASLLQEGYELGVISLLLLGSVLLGAGHGGPAGSAGVVSAGVSLLSIAVLPPLLSRALRTTHRDFLREDRASRLGAAVLEQVDHEVLTRIGLVILKRFCERETIDLRPFGGGDRESPAEAILAGEIGVVGDIRLGRLIRLRRRVGDSGQVELTSRLAEYVGSQSSLLWLPAGASGRARRLALRVVKVEPGRRRDETLSRYLDDLQEEAIAAIRSGGPATFEFVADAYVQTLMEFPRSWRRYGQQYDQALAKGTEFFPIGPVDEIRHQFHTNVTEALRAGGQEVLATAAYLPMRVSAEALEYRADGLLAKMLSLSSAFLAAAWAHGGDVGRSLERPAYRHLVEFARFYLRPRLEQGELADRLRIGGHLRLVYAQIQEMLRMGVEAGRVDFARKLDGDWGTLLKQWHVELLSPNPYEIPYLEEAVANGEAGAADRLAQARENAQLTALAQELVDYRTVARFGLALWAWRQQPPSWRESFTYFSSQMGSLSQITETVTKALDAEDYERMPWSDWILNELQEGEAHAIGTTEAIVQTFVAMALRAFNPDEPTPSLPPRDWMPQHLPYARDLLGNAVDDPQNSDLPDVALRAEKIGQALELAAAGSKDRERLKVIEAPVVQEKVDEFCEQARAALRKDRVVPDLLRLGNALASLDARPETPPLLESRTHKALFVADGRMIGADMIASDVGRQTAHFELGQLIEPMASIERVAIVAQDAPHEDAQEFAEQLRGAIGRIIETADSPFVALFLPIQWRLSQALGLSFLGSGVEPPEQWALSESGAHDFAGFFADVPAFHFPEVPEEVLYVVDLAHYVTGEVWPLADEQMVSLRVLTDAEARERAGNTSGSDEVGEEEITLRWLEQALVTVDPGLRLSDDRDDAAITAIELPSSLRRM